MAITKSEVFERVRLNLDDAGVGTYYQDEDLDTSLVDVYDDIVTQTLPFETDDDISYQANKVYYDLYNTLPYYILPVAIWDGRGSRWLTQKSVEYFNSLDYKWESTHGNPLNYAVLDFKQIAFYPHPSNTSGTFTVHYKFRPTEPGSSDTIVLSRHNDQMLVDGMTEDLLAQADEFTKASIYMRDYNAAIKRERTLIEGRTSPDRLFRLSRQEVRNQYGA